MADTTSLRAYYQDSLLFQWVQATKARATIGALVDCAIADLLIHDIRDAFDIETAVGPQLDVIGEFIGFSRDVYGEIARPYFQFDDYVTPNTTAVGMTDYIDPLMNPGSSLYRYAFASEAVYQLEDEEYRFMLKLKRELNRLSNTLHDIQEVLYDFLGTDITLYDLRDMTIGYYIKPTAGRFAELAASQGILPKPMGVGLSGIFEADDPLAVFGFQDYILEMGNTTGFGDYVGGPSGRIWLDYGDRL